MVAEQGGSERTRNQTRQPVSGLFLFWQLGDIGKIDGFPIKIGVCFRQFFIHFDVFYAEKTKILQQIKDYNGNDHQGCVDENPLNKERISCNQIVSYRME